MLDLESEAMRGLGSIPTGGNILSLDFFCFHAVKTKMPILAFLCLCQKPDCHHLAEANPFGCQHISGDVQLM